MRAVGLALCLAALVCVSVAAAGRSRGASADGVHGHLHHKRASPDYGPAVRAAWLSCLTECEPVFKQVEICNRFCHWVDTVHNTESIKNTVNELFNSESGEEALSMAMRETLRERRQRNIEDDGEVARTFVGSFTEWVSTLKKTRKEL
eukprot:m51a1_g10889 hypothetical protein (148) ;mRNA; r:9216-9734